MHALLKALIDGFPDPAFVAESGRIVSANMAARGVLGAEAEGRDIRLAIRQPAALAALLAEDGERRAVEIVGLGGAERHWLLRVVPLPGGARFAQLTDRSAAHAAERMRVDFVANASHELRTPLATIVGYAETLREQDDIDAPTRRRFVGILHDEARRMQRVVEDLISLSRIEAERFNPPTEQVALAALAGQVLGEHRRAAEARGSDLRLAAAPDVPPVVGDSSQLLQVIDNLVANALRYGRAGTPVTVTVAREGKKVRLSVADEGEGIPAEFIPRLTERFFRVDSSRSRALGGTGLGLSIVKHIAERHRGRLEIASVPGEGTTVTILFPAAADVTKT